jgi:hypothetical protein
LQDINGVRFLAKLVDLDANGAKDLAYEIGNTAKNIFLVLATATDDKPMLTCYISKELVAEKISMQGKSCANWVNTSLAAAADNRFLQQPAEKTYSGFPKR